MVVSWCFWIFSENYSPLCEACGLLSQWVQICLEFAFILHTCIFTMINTCEIFLICFYEQILIWLSYFPGKIRWFWKIKAMNMKEREDNILLWPRHQCTIFLEICVFQFLYHYDLIQTQCGRRRSLPSGSPSSLLRWDTNPCTFMKSVE